MRKAGEHLRGWIDLYMCEHAAEARSHGGGSHEDKAGILKSCRGAVLRLVRRAVGWGRSRKRGFPSWMHAPCGGGGGGSRALAHQDGGPALRRRAYPGQLRVCFGRRRSPVLAPRIRTRTASVLFFGILAASTAAAAAVSAADAAAVSAAAGRVNQQPPSVTSRCCGCGCRASPGSVAPRRAGAGWRQSRRRSTREGRPAQRAPRRRLQEGPVNAAAGRAAEPGRRGRGGARERRRGAAAAAAATAAGAAAAAAVAPGTACSRLLHWHCAVECNELAGSVETGRGGRGYVRGPALTYPWKKDTRVRAVQTALVPRSSAAASDAGAFAATCKELWVGERTGRQRAARGKGSAPRAHRRGRC
eukprot:363303-Chlamydomonas_euryale.AAC.6